MIPDSSLVDLDDLAHCLLVTHRLLLHSMKKPSILKVRKILYVIVVLRDRQAAQVGGQLADDLTDH